MKTESYDEHMKKIESDAEEEVENFFSKVSPKNRQELVSRLVSKLYVKNAVILSEIENLIGVVEFLSEELKKHDVFFAMLKGITPATHSKIELIDVGTGKGDK